MGDSAETVPGPSSGDVKLAIEDLGPWLYELYFLPGDWLLRATISAVPNLAAFFDIGTDDYRGVLSGFISTLAWLSLLIAGSIGYHAIRDADRAMTRGIAGFAAYVARSARIALALLKGYRRRRREPAPAQVEFVEEIELDEEEVRALRLHGELSPGYALAVSEAASKLGARVHQVSSMLARLKKLGLLEDTLGGAEGDSAYRITRAGRAWLIFRQMAARG